VNRRTVPVENLNPVVPVVRHEALLPPPGDRPRAVSGVHVGIVIDSLAGTVAVER